MEISNSNAIPWYILKVSFRPSLSHKGLAILRCSRASNEHSRHPLEIQLSLPAGLRHFRKSLGRFKFGKRVNQPAEPPGTMPTRMNAEHRRRPQSDFCLPEINPALTGKDFP